MFKLLSSECTNLFPSLLYVDEECMVMVQENVNDQGQSALEWKDRWTADFETYNDQISNAYVMFEKLRIFPDDLNICCNMIVNGPEIKIIDFGFYKIVNNPAILKKKLETTRKRILEDIFTIVEKQIPYQGWCPGGPCRNG
jgi:hypothetical protein